MRWLIEAIVDLLWPPDAESQPVSFGRKLAVLLLLAAMIAVLWLLKE